MKSTGRGQDGKPQRADHAVIEAQCKQIICDHRRLAMMKDAPSFVVPILKPEHFEIRVFHGWNAQLNLAPERSKRFRLKPNRREL
jgi:hypothetical protein